MCNNIVAYLKDGTYAFNATLPISPSVGEFFESGGMLFEIKRVTYCANPGYGTCLTIKLIVDRIR